METLRVHCNRVFQLPLCIGEPIQIHITTRVSILSVVKMNNSYMLHHKKKLNGPNTKRSKERKKKQQQKIAVRSNETKNKKERK